ncbi:MAG TPA: PLDc N-terminal domain-containing protein [Chitinophagaceae bacterium]|nr:PLDc N-terminal domain-containing protein [Chitinophagaceae bacterium]
MLLDFFSALVSGYLILVGMWLLTLIIVLITLFKRKDIMLPVKIFWAVIIFIAPVIGLVFYLIKGLPKQKKLLDMDKQKI